MLHVTYPDLEMCWYDCYIVDASGKQQWIGQHLPLKAVETIQSKAKEPCTRFGWGFWTSSGVFVGKMIPVNA